MVRCSQIGSRGQISLKMLRSLNTLRASVNPIFSRHVLALRLLEFVARFSDLTTTIVQQSDAGDLVAEGMDVAIRFGRQPPSSLSSRLLLRIRVLTVAAPAYLERC